MFHALQSVYIKHNNDLKKSPSYAKASEGILLLQMAVPFEVRFANVEWWVI